MIGGRFGRVCRVTVQRRDGLSTTVAVIEGLRTQFSIKRDSASTPNTIDVTLTNLGPESRELLARRGLVVRVEAGHAGEYRLLAVGDVRYAASRRDGAEWLTQILAGDGATTYRTSRIAKSYAAGTPARTVVSDCAAALGFALPRDVLDAPELRAQVASGLVADGLAHDALTNALAPLGLSWSIQNDRIQILRAGQTRADRVYVLDESNGLIGVPEVSTPAKGSSKRSLTVRALLYPEIVPGSPLSIVSRTITATCKAAKVSHSGDTHGEDWTTEIEADLR